MATTNYSFNLPTVGGSEDAWGTSLNANWTALDTLLGGTNATEFAILDGATVTTAEFNHLSGVTSAVQTQINSKAASAITVSAGAGLTGGGDLTANRTIAHADTSSQASVDNSGRVYVQDITLDTYGHVTAIGSTTVPDDSIGVGQTWQIVSRSDGVSFQNTTGKPIMAMVQGNSAAGIDVDGVRASGGNNNNFICTHTVIVPNGSFYVYFNSSGSKAELR